MPEWKYTGKKVTDMVAKRSLDAVKSACFSCDTHSSDCSIARAAGEINEMLEAEV